MRLGHRKKKGANETMVNQYDLSKGAKRLEEVEPSLIRTILDRATALRGEGKSVIPFSAGEPDFNTPSDIKEATYPRHYQQPDQIQLQPRLSAPAQGTEGLYSRGNRRGI